MLVWAPASLAQLPNPVPSTSGQSSLPQGVERIGYFETAPVYLDSQLLFRVTAATVVDRQNPGEQVPVETRAQIIENNLKQVITPQQSTNRQSFPLYEAVLGGTAYDPDTLVVEVAELNNQPILMVRDQNHVQPRALLTVTDLDARYQAMPLEDLATRWQDTVQTALVEALHRRQPAVVKQRVKWAIAIVLAMMGGSLMLMLWQRFLHRRHRYLGARHAAEQQAQRSQRPDDPLPPSRQAEDRMAYRQQFVEGVRSQINLERRLALISLLQWLSVWGQGLIWLAGILWIHSLLPRTLPLFNNLSTQLPSLMVIWFLVGLMNRIGNIAINRFAKAWEENQFLLLEDDQRRSLRIPTIVRSVKGFKTFAVYIVGLGWALNTLGVSLSSVITLSAVLALAISFASQSLVKDLVNGFLILLEDQYAIGDWITIGTAAGLVENLNLRVTQLRDMGGQLITIPNSQITQVENWTRTWSRVDFTITVAYDTDVEKALEVVSTVANDLYYSPEWGTKLLEPPDLLGVDSVSHEGMTIRVWIVTKPMQQFPVRREMNRRVRLALETHNIEVGIPQQILWHRQVWEKGHISSIRELIQRPMTETEPDAGTSDASY